MGKMAGRETKQDLEVVSVFFTRIVGSGACVDGQVEREESVSSTDSSRSSGRHFGLAPMTRIETTELEKTIWV